MLWVLRITVRITLTSQKKNWIYLQIPNPSKYKITSGFKSKSMFISGLRVKDKEVYLLQNG